MNNLVGVLTKVLSHCVGALADIPVPGPLRTVIISSFARIIRADLSEAQHPPASYRSCGDYFCRALKPGLRPLAETPVISPVDGTLRLVCSAGQPVEQIKGETYTVQELLASASEPYTDGSIGVFYLAPHNYHRVHAPVDGVIESVTYIKGPLWPVNSWGLGHIKRLFCVNERIVLRGRSALSVWALVMVGATNVGRMELSFLNVRELISGDKQTVCGSWPVKRGMELGAFRLGSTVILVTSFKLAALEQQRMVRYGEEVALS